MELAQCPYDGSDLDIGYSGGSMLIDCLVCGAEWERHGSWMHRVHDPDPAIVRKVRTADLDPEASPAPQ